MAIKLAYIKYKRVCLQINRVYTIVRKWLIVNNFEQCCGKLVATLTIDTTDIFLITIWQKWYNGREPWMFLCFFPFKNQSKFFDFILLLKINEACCVNKWLHSFMYVFVTYIWNIIKTGSLVTFKNTLSRSSRKTWRLRKFEIDSIFLNRSCKFVL